MRKLEDQEKAVEAEPKPRVVSAFDTTGPSLLMDGLRRVQRATEVALKKRLKNPSYVGWSIGKSDPDHQFMMRNREQFGTRQRKPIK